MSGACFADSFARAKESLERLDTFTILQWSASGRSYPPGAILARLRRLSIRMVRERRRKLETYSFDTAQIHWTSPQNTNGRSGCPERPLNSLPHAVAATRASRS